MGNVRKLTAQREIFREEKGPSQKKGGVGWMEPCPEKVGTVKRKGKNVSSFFHVPKGACTGIDFGTERSPKTD